MLNRFSRIPVRNHTNMNNVFRLVNLVYGMDTYIFKLNVFTKEAKYE